MPAFVSRTSTRSLTSRVSSRKILNSMCNSFTKCAMVVKSPDATQSRTVLTLVTVSAVMRNSPRLFVRRFSCRPHGRHENLRTNNRGEFRMTAETGTSVNTVLLCVASGLFTTMAHFVKELHMEFKILREETRDVRDRVLVLETKAGIK